MGHLETPPGPVAGARPWLPALTLLRMPVPGCMLKDPDAPDCDKRALGDSGIDFAGEYRVARVEDDKNRHHGKGLFMIRSALECAGVEIPCPHHAIGNKGAMRWAMA
tara:strand:+ start:2640 stop:2960 length:321 start_codon:yes stop_codon:yes gene_type:complete